MVDRWPPRENLGPESAVGWRLSLGGAERAVIRALSVVRGHIGGPGRTGLRPSPGSAFACSQLSDLVSAPSSVTARIQGLALPALADGSDVTPSLFHATALRHLASEGASCSPPLDSIPGRSAGHLTGEDRRSRRGFPQAVEVLSNVWISCRKVDLSSVGLSPLRRTERGASASQTRPRMWRRRETGVHQRKMPEE